MHRSGTSAITRLLALLGADLPADLVAPGKANLTGFWEPTDLVAINDEILVTAGSSWHDVSPFPSSWFGSPEAERYQKRALPILERDFARSSLFVLKDPRICKLVPFWISLLGEFGAEVSFVLAIRNPLEVAASLEALLPSPHGQSASKALLLWLRHVLDAEIGTRGHPRSFLFYDDQLVGDWRAVVDELARDLQIIFPRLDHAAAAEIDAFLSQGLRHHRFTSGEVEGSADVPTWVKRAYSALKNGPDKGNDCIPETFDRIRAELEPADRAFGPMLAKEAAQAAHAAAEIDLLKEDLDRRQELLGEKDAEIQRLRSALDAAGSRSGR